MLLEESGIIRGRVALLDAEKLDLGVTVFVSWCAPTSITMPGLKLFNDAVAQIPEVVELWPTSGDIDYLMKIVVANIAHYDRVYKRLIKLVKLTDVSSSFAMEQMKYTTVLPVLPSRTGDDVVSYCAKSVDAASSRHSLTSRSTNAFFSPSLRHRIAAERHAQRRVFRFAPA